MSSSYILSDNGVSSGSAGLKSSAGNDGVLVLQTANSSGTATNAVYVDTSQNVGLGGTPSYKLDVTSGSTNTLRLKGSGSISLYSYHDSGGVGFSNAAPYTGGVLLYFYNGQTELYSSGNNVFSVTSGNSISLQGATPKAGTGITFPATQNASSNVKTLDDYEEGTFTPRLFSDGTEASNYATQVGYYRKIGSQVTVWFAVTATTIPSGSYLRFAGLPFSVNMSGTGYQNLNSAAASNGKNPIYLETYTGTSGQAFTTASGYANPSSFASVAIGGVYTYIAS